MRRTLTAITIGAAALGCAIELTETIEGTGPISSEIRQADMFTTVEVEGNLRCVIEVGGTSTLLSVHGHGNLLGYLATTVDDGVLTIGRNANVHLVPAPEVRLLVPKLAAVCLEGSGVIEVVGLDGESFSVDLAGSGRIQAAGRVSRLDVELTGSGEVDLVDLVATEVEVDTTGSGYVYVHATESLEVDISGSGHVLYRGSPDVSADTKGSGAVRRLTE
ncbi:MAG: DUF2807 domain-containing protein [Planctomycetota bacterium]|nr:DUF2807 domain-containing protein [Planctomycetota bacterium]